MKKIRCGVVGVGYLGQYHAEKYSKLNEAELTIVCDSVEERASEISTYLNCQKTTNYQEFLGKVDAVSIVVPTAYHFETAKFFLEQGIHVLLEKPMTSTVEEADELISIAERNKLVFQIGHLERFNPVLIAARQFLNCPLYIESHRLTTFKPRGTDINVMLDLMIHDIDIIQMLMDSPVREIRANGAAILSERPDIATARIQFENACVANVVASRVSFKTERKMRIFQHDAYVFLDLHNKIISIHRKGKGEMFPGIPEIVKQEQTFDGGDALFDEIKAFINSIQHDLPPAVSGYDGRKALATAIEITKLVNEQFDQANQFYENKLSQ